MTILAFVDVVLVPDGTLILHILMILVMVWILNRTLFRPINKILESREKNSGGRSSEAHEILNKVQEKNATFNAAILDARNEGYQLIEAQRAKAVAERQSKMEEVKSEVSTLLATEKEVIAQQTVAAKVSINAEAQKMAEKISGNILKA